MRCRFAANILIATCVLGVATRQQEARAATLVGDPFVSPYTGWVDPHPDMGGSWRLNLHQHAPDNPTSTLMDTFNANPPTTGGITNGGNFEPHLLVQDNFTHGANYELKATMRTNDDDILGLVFNYQDLNNYFRATLRQQPSSGNFGGTEGFSIQKFVNGTLTQIWPTTPGATFSPITQNHIDNRTPFEFKVSVTGNSINAYFDGQSQFPGGIPITDNDLVAGRKVGFQSWAQSSDSTAVTPTWGTEIDSVTLTDQVNPIFSHTFNNTGVKWRHLQMKNSNNITMPELVQPRRSPSTTASTDDIGNFGLDINDRWIVQHGNAFESATSTTPNVDFMSTAIVVDEPGSAAFSNYEMKVRIAADDNDGTGVLVRVQDDNTFYRVNFATQVIGTGTDRCPQGLSVQKVRNGVWSELFRDDQLNLQFVPSVGVEPATGSEPLDRPGTPGLQDGGGNNLFYDLSVKAEGNTLTIQVIDHLGNVVNYAPIVDATDPLLTGTVGFQVWGTVGTYFMNYGGVNGTPLLTSIGAPPHPGDFDSDGDVDGADFVAWQTNFPKASGALLSEGDADGDGDVDGADFVVWQTNFPFTPGPGSSPVPEPHAFLLVALAVPALVAARRRRK
jgi:hypothetical protein